MCVQYETCLNSSNNAWLQTYSTIKTYVCASKTKLGVFPQNDYVLIEQYSTPNGSVEIYNFTTSCSSVWVISNLAQVNIDKDVSLYDKYKYVCNVDCGSTD